MKDERRKQINKKAIMGVVGLVLVLVIIFGGVRISIAKRNKEIQRADNFVAMGNYQNAISIYDNALNKKYSDDLLAKRDRALELMESQENLRAGLEAYEEDDIVRAIKLLSKVSAEDEKSYEQASSELANIEEYALVDIEELIEKDQLDQAEVLVNTYLKAWPKNVKMKNAKDEIQAKHIEAKKQAENEENDRKNKESEAVVAAKQAEADAITESKNIEKSKAKREEVESTASGIIGSYKSIISDQANLRSAPTLNSKVLTTLSKGTNVYIYDTQVESSERIWCLVEVLDYHISGWISYNTMNYTIP